MKVRIFSGNLLFSSSVTIIFIAVVCIPSGFSIARLAQANSAEYTAPAVENNQTDSQDPASQWQTIQMKVTAYCPCPKCCGIYSDGVTACGHTIEHADVFVAADRKFDFGTEMVIEGYNNSKPVKVMDRGGAIRGNHIDVFFATHQQALNWGVQYVDVKVRSLPTDRDDS